MKIFLRILLGKKRLFKYCKNALGCNGLFLFSRKFSSTFLEFAPKKHGFGKSPREAVGPFKTVPKFSSEKFVRRVNCFEFEGGGGDLKLTNTVNILRLKIQNLGKK